MRNLPKGTIVSKSGLPTKTAIWTVFRKRLRRRNQIKGNFIFAYHFACGPPPNPPGYKQNGRQAEGEDRKKPSKQTIVP